MTDRPDWNDDDIIQIRVGDMRAANRDVAEEVLVQLKLLEAEVAELKRSELAAKERCRAVERSEAVLREFVGAVRDKSTWAWQRSNELPRYGNVSLDAIAALRLADEAKGQTPCTPANPNAGVVGNE